MEYSRCKLVYKNSYIILMLDINVNLYIKFVYNTNFYLYVSNLRFF